MTFQLRPAVQEDYPRVAQLMSQVEPQPVTADDLLEWDTHELEGHVYHLFLAIDDNALTVGCGTVERGSWLPSGFAYGWITVDSACRGRGAGRLLYGHVADLARKHDATWLMSKVNDDDPGSLEFARRRGFSIERHLFESVIDLTNFDANRFSDLIPAVEATGIRLRSLAEVGDTTEYRRQLWEVNQRASLDDPASAGAFLSYEDFCHIVFESSWFDPHGQILALAGDQVIGLSAVAYFADDNTARNNITGVDKAYRGRGLAQALKLRSIRFAQDRGAASIYTFNDSTNAPMLAINRKLGYQPRSGVYRLRATLSPTPASRP